MKKPNIVLLMCDQFRGDCLSVANHPDVKTPYLDTLAKEGVYFPNAYSSCPSCIPARAALLTGRSQRRHGRVGYEDGIPWKYSHYLAQSFSEASYQTQCIGKMHVHPARSLCGFQSILLHDGYLGYNRSSTIPSYLHQIVCDDYLYELHDRLGEQADVTSSGIDCNSFLTHPWPYEEALHPTNWVVDKSIRFLHTRDREKPFFLMTSFVRPHQPLDAPQSYFDLYKDKPLQMPPEDDWRQTIRKTPIGYDSIYGCDDEDTKRQAMAGYYASITHVDHQIGRLITALKEDGCYEDTILLFVSDHGEMLFDHGLWRKVFPYQGSIHIPLIFRIGNKVMDCSPHVDDSILELRDIMPTLLSLCELSIPDGVDGCSFLPQLASMPTAGRSYLHGEHSFHSQLSNHFIVTKTDKYIWYSETGVEQYFDLVKDPLETHNAIQDVDARERIQLLKSCLIQELADREEGYSDGKKLITGRNPVNMISYEP